MRAELTLIANAGLRVAAREAVIYVDAFHRCQVQRVVPWPADRPLADLILVTHAHWDHFDARSVAEAAGLTGATVVGPRSVVQDLRGKVPPGKLCEMEPPLARGAGDALCTSVEFPAAKVRAYRTFHSRDHNSYLVETASFRFFHDGDNEDTRRVAARSLGKLDAVLAGLRARKAALPKTIPPIAAGKGLSVMGGKTLNVSPGRQGLGVVSSPGNFARDASTSGS